MSEYYAKLEEMKEFRRKIHQFPEVGWDEEMTTASIIEVLKKHQIPCKRLRPTGVIADIVPEGMENDPILALRADIDALPILETTGLPYSSKKKGVSHACGHDFHIASVLGAGIALAQKREFLPHPVRLIFQPAEETRPSGSVEVIKQGGLENVKEIYAIHVEPKLEVGKIGIRSGAITSAADIINVTLKGDGGHSSRPHLTADIVQALSSVVMNTATIFSRIFDPRAVVSITWGKIEAGYAPNAIPNEGILQGTIRTTEIQEWQEAEGVVQRVIESIVAPYRVELEIDYEKGVPPVVNDELAVRKIEQAIVETHGQDAIYHAERSLGGEDFAWYLQEKQSNGEKVLGAMVRMGAAKFADQTQDIHQSDLIIAEELLDYSIPFLVKLSSMQNKLTEN